MAGPESPQQAPQQPKDIPGFKGLEQLNKIESLKKGAFREFIDKVVAIRSNPEAQKKVTDALQKIDNNPTLSDEQKKEQLRSQPSTELLAIIGKNIEFGEKGMSVTLDFGKLAFAEKTAIGAGHLFPPNTQNISFGDAQGGTVAKRTAGTRGGEYRSEKDKYMSSFTGTKIFIAYKDILPLDAQQMESAIRTEKGSTTKVRAVVDTASAAQTDLRATAQIKRPEAPDQETAAPLPDSKEAKEVLIARRPVFIGDSQVEGLRPSLSKRGIKAFDYRGLRMETIAQRIENMPESEKQFIKNADTIVLQCGGNNLASSEGYTLEKMQKNFYKLINTMRSINPSARIRVGTQMAPGEGSRNKETRFAYNAWLKEEAAKTGKFSIVDTYALTEDPNNPGHRMEQLFGGSTNPHLKMREYGKLSPKMLEAINYQAA